MQIGIKQPGSWHWHEPASKIPFAAFYLSDAPILIGIRRAVLEYSFSKNFEK